MPCDPDQLRRNQQPADVGQISADLPIRRADLVYPTRYFVRLETRRCTFQPGNTSSV